MLVAKQLTVAIDFHNMKKKYNGSQWLPSNIWLPTFFKISSMQYVQHKKEAHTGLEQV